MMIITIDGPTASGKSSVAKLLAQRLHMHCLNTGLLYRAVAYVIYIAHGDDYFQNPEHITALTEHDVAWIDDIRYQYNDQGDPFVMYRDQNITPHLFQDIISRYASLMSSSLAVREKLLIKQRAIAQQYDIIADGRDCGSVVFPQAEAKFYLTASAHVRARRRMKDLTLAGNEQALQAVVKNIQDRDERDMSRSVAPLTIPADAHIVDTTELSLQETVELFMRLLQRNNV